MNILSNNNKITLVLAGEVSSGGMVDYLLCWINKLTTEGNEVQVIATKEVLELPEFKVYLPEVKDIVELPFSGCTVKRRYIKHLIQHAIRLPHHSYRSIIERIRLFSPSYIHIVDESILLPFIYRHLVSTGFRIVVTVHDYIYHEGQFRSKFAYFASMYSRRYIVQHGGQLHFHNHCLVPSDLPKKRIVVWEHPLPRTMFPRKAYLDNKNVSIGFMGRIEPYKGVKDLPDILSLFEEHYPHDFNFFIAGRGQGIVPEQYKKLRCNVDIQNRFLSNEEFHRLMANLDVLLLPYRTATQSGVAYLAKAYGVKIVGYDVGALGEFLNNYKEGYCASSIDYHSLVESLIAAVSDLNDRMEL